MSERTVFILGTAAQVPTRERNHHGCFVRWDAEGLLLDPGEGTQRQLIHAGIAVSSITKILITHFHGDHCLGLPGIIQRLSLDRVGHPVEIFFPASGSVYLERLRKASAFHDTLDLRLKPVSKPGIVSHQPHLDIEAMPLQHPLDCYGYRISEPERYTMDPRRLDALGIHGPDVGRLKRYGRIERNGRTIRLEEAAIRSPGQSLCLIMDTRMCENALRLARHSTLLICEATFADAKKAHAHNFGHLTAVEAAQLAARAGVRRLILTHFSQAITELQEIESEASAFFAQTIVARDGQKIAFPKRRRSVP